MILYDWIYYKEKEMKIILKRREKYSIDEKLEKVIFMMVIFSLTIIQKLFWKHTIDVKNTPQLIPFKV